MDKDRVSYLYQSYLDGSLTGDDRDEFQLILLNIDLDDLMKEVLDDELNTLNFLEHQDLSLERSEFIYNKITANRTITKKSNSLWKKLLVAAAVIIVMSAGYYVYISTFNGQDVKMVHKNDVSPGRFGATLTLASGKKIRLDDARNGELEEESGMVITKSADGQLIYEFKKTSADRNQLNTLSTSNGETYQVRLPDGSVVWLNSASSLTYSPGLISSGKRFVKLTGEGFFNISKDKLHPFIVETDNQKIKVLGTHFNVNSYPDEPFTATTLLEGSVNVTSEGEQKLIVPGQQVINKNHSLKVIKVNVDQIIDWKEGDFNLTETDFRIAMRKVARWYNVEMVYDPAVPKNIQVDGWISRNQKLSSVLDMIEKLGVVSFRIEGKKVYVSPR